MSQKYTSCKPLKSIKYAFTIIVADDGTISVLISDLHRFLLKANISRGYFKVGAAATGCSDKRLQLGERRRRGAAVQTLTMCRIKIQAGLGWVGAVSAIRWSPLPALGSSHPLASHCVLAEAGLIQGSLETTFSFG